jgi:hypothetical protein
LLELFVTPMIYSNVKCRVVCEIQHVIYDYRYAPKYEYNLKNNPVSYDKAAEGETTVFITSSS